MTDRSDEAQSVAFGVMLMALLVVVALVLMVATGTAFRAKGGGAVAGAASASAAAASAEPEVLAIRFDGESVALPFEALPVLARLADRVRADTARVVRIVALHASGGDSLHAFTAALERSDAVRHALEAHGVAPAQVRVDDPKPTASGTPGAPGVARVELHVE